MNPRYCNLCEQASREFPGRAEVEMSTLFADVRGSTALSEQMSPTEFSQLINRFYTVSTQLINAEDGLVDKLAGDAVAAFWGVRQAASAGRVQPLATQRQTDRRVGSLGGTKPARSSSDVRCN